MKKVCVHCNEIIICENAQQFGAHVTNCKCNPKRQDILNKIIITKKKKYKIFKLCCLFCKTEYELELTDKQFENGKYKKFCCKSCSAKYSQSFISQNHTKIVKCILCGDNVKIPLNARNINFKCVKCIGDYKTKEGVRYGKIVNGVSKQYKIINNQIVCNFCGEKDCKSEICKSWYKGRSKTFIKFGFDVSKLGTNLFYDEYNRIIELLKDEYKTNSMVEISEKYNINFQTIFMLFEKLNIKRRNNSDSGRLAIKKGRQKSSNNQIYPYKADYHVSWNDKKYWLRSSYEIEYAKILDNNQINYEVESLRIQYYDTQKCHERTSIPDFYLPETNEIIEIKSKWTLDEINMNDKITSYKKLGYNVRLVIGEGRKNFFEKLNERLY